MPLDDARTRLTWLCPSAASLVALARLPTDAAWEAVRHDPGAVLLILRCAPPHSRGPTNPASLITPAVLDGALRLLDSPGAHFVNWSVPPARAVYEASVAHARMARELAVRTERADPECAWTAGLLWQLDRLASCVLPTVLSKAGPTPVVRGLTRRLATRWRLPAWLTAVIGYADLAPQLAEQLGADPGLYQVTQAAAALVGLQPTATQTSAAVSLGAAEAALHGLSAQAPIPVAPWTDPSEMPILRDLLALAIENRRLKDSPVILQLEGEVDALCRALAAQAGGEAQRLHEHKLRGLSELAAGAGHEINNPLAVISGQAQYLLRKVREEACERAADRGDPEGCSDEAAEALAGPLHTIVQQCQRIHHVLRELMHFARPPRPLLQSMDLRSLVASVLAAQADLAAMRGVRLLGPANPAGQLPVPVVADPGQLGTALSCLVRNAIEAAPAGGWADVRLDLASDTCVKVVVEDNGPGLDARAREHLFDPFFSGRSAGRGRGLGLPTAWALARQNCGDVQFVHMPDGPTRFVLTLPRGTSAARCA